MERLVKYNDTYLNQDRLLKSEDNLYIRVIKLNKIMVVTIHKTTTKEKMQEALEKLDRNIEKKYQKQKEQILQETFGKICFNSTKTEVEIQRELRNEWN